MRFAISSMMTAAAMMLVQAAYSGGGPPEYEVTAIIEGFDCPPFGLASVNPSALNEAGDVAGHVTCPIGVTRAFRWTAETGLELIPMPPQTSESRAVAISGSKVVGYHAVSGDEFGHLGFLYDFETDEFTSLGTLPGGNWSEALDINSAGQIAGFWGNNLIGPWQAFIWEDGEMIDLGPSIGGADNRAFGINNSGAITGWWREDGGERIAFVWEDGKVNSTGPIPGGFTSLGTAINCRDQLTVSGNFNEDHPQGFINGGFLWEAGRWTDLGMLAGYDSMALTGLTDGGDVVGWSRAIEISDEPDVGFVWRDGVMKDLNDLIPPGTQLQIKRAVGINETGQIAASAHSDALNATVGLLLSPVNQGVLGDLDNDGQVGASDLLILLASWGPCEDCRACAADLDGNGNVGASDLLILLSNWG